MFAEQSLSYDFKDNNKDIVKKTRPTYVDMPFMLKFKSARRENLRVYVLAGFQYSYNLAAGKEKQSENEFDPTSITIKSKRDLYSYSFGFGLDLYNTYFKFSPEIKITNGITSALVTEKTAYSTPIEQFFPRAIVLSFLFE